MTVHRLIAAVLATTLLSCAATAAGAEHLTGQQLLALCTANMGGNGNPMEAAECLGYVVGVADTFDCEEAAHGFHWNVKAEASQPQLAVTVISYLQSQPAALSVPAHINVAQALSQAYPCPKSAAAN